MEDAGDLVTQKYGGSLSGEHGDGQARAELLPKMFSEEIVGAFREFKSIWDPDNKMNPAKVSDPYPLDANLRISPTYRTRSVETHFKFSNDAGSFAEATERCFGAGACRQLGGATMCPSFMVIREEKHSTRGRARMLFEMMHASQLKDGWHDESVKESLDLCLACKGCKSDCPVRVDMATYKVEFLSHYYEGRLRTWFDLLGVPLGLAHPRPREFLYELLEKLVVRVWIATTEVDGWAHSVTTTMHERIRPKRRHHLRLGVMALLAPDKGHEVVGSSRPEKPELAGRRFGNSSRNLGPSLAFLTLLAAFFLVAGCGGEDQQGASQPEGTAREATGGDAAGDPASGSGDRTDLSEGSVFTLNEEAPVPPDFRAAYRRGAPITVEFFEKGEDPYYPQGLDVDAMVNDDLTDLRSDYPAIEFFTYDVDNPGVTGNGEGLERGEYGTLAAQLDVGYTPFVAMLEPRAREEGYVVQDIFEGYSEEGVLDQALFDLVDEDPEGVSSDVDVVFDRVELTEDGSGVEYVTMTNQGDEEVVLSGFALGVVDAGTGRPESSLDRWLSIGEGAVLDPGEEASVGRAPDVVDANGREVIGTFEGSGSLTIESGDQVALLDRDDTVVDTVSV